MAHLPAGRKPLYKEQLLEAIRSEALESLGFFLKPSELFSELAKEAMPMARVSLY